VLKYETTVSHNWIRNKPEEWSWTGNTAPFVRKTPRMRLDHVASFIVNANHHKQVGISEMRGRKLAGQRQFRLAVFPFPIVICLGLRSSVINQL
jgi:hypothetical protein